MNMNGEDGTCDCQREERAGNLLSRDSLLVVGEVDVGAELDVLEGAFPPPQQAEGESKG